MKKVKMLLVVLLGMVCYGRQVCASEAVIGGGVSLSQAAPVGAIPAFIKRYLTLYDTNGCSVAGKYLVEQVSAAEEHYNEVVGFICDCLKDAHALMAECGDVELWKTLSCRPQTVTGKDSLRLRDEAFKVWRGFFDGDQMVDERFQAFLIGLKPVLCNLIGKREPLATIFEDGILYRMGEEEPLLSGLKNRSHGESDCGSIDIPSLPDLLERYVFSAGLPAAEVDMRVKMVHKFVVASSGFWGYRVVPLFLKIAERYPSLARYCFDVINRTTESGCLFYLEREEKAGELRHILDKNPELEGDFGHLRSDADRIARLRAGGVWGEVPSFIRDYLTLYDTNGCSDARDYLVKQVSAAEGHSGQVVDFICGRLAYVSALLDKCHEPDVWRIVENKPKTVVSQELLHLRNEAFKVWLGFFGGCQMTDKCFEDFLTKLKPVLCGLIGKEEPRCIILVEPILCKSHCGFIDLPSLPEILERYVFRAELPGETVDHCVDEVHKFVVASSGFWGYWAVPLFLKIAEFYPSLAQKCFDAINLTTERGSLFDSGTTSQVEKLSQLLDKNPGLERDFGHLRLHTASAVHKRSSAAPRKKAKISK